MVFGQIFMWNGFTGVHWNVIADIQPAQGYRLVYQTFPGGIHSGADFYLNEAGIEFEKLTSLDGPVGRLIVTHFHPDHLGLQRHERRGAAILRG